MSGPRHDVQDGSRLDYIGQTRSIGLMECFRRPIRHSAVILLFCVTGLLLAEAGQRELDIAARQWVDEKLQEMTLDQKLGQLLFSSFYSVYVSSDGTTYDDLAALVNQYHVGGFHIFGARVPRPNVLLNSHYSRTALGEPLNAASLINRLQSIASVPLLVTADFETGVGFRMRGGTVFPRAMAFGAAQNSRLAYEAGRITAIEARAIGVHVNFGPVADVNNNPRNPVINTRSFGEDPVKVGELASAYVEGLKAGGMLATAKHFPGHGDTEVDSHLGLPIISHPRERLERVELIPFKSSIAAGADAVMTAHIQLPALEPAARTPATFSFRIVEQLLRDELGFDGLVFTDSMRMRAISDLMPPGQAAARAVTAGHDVILHSPDDALAFGGLKTAVIQGQLTEARLDNSVRRILTAKARLGLHRQRVVNLDTLPAIVGTRSHRAVAQDVSERSLTLIKDDHGYLPLPTERNGSILYLSVLDYPEGWGIGAPSRTFIPELEARWENVTAVELSDQTPLSELDLVRAAAPRYDAVVAGIFVRTASFSGRMDLSSALIDLLKHLGQESVSMGKPFVAILFGNPYTATFLSELPTILLTYDFYDVAEASAVRAVAGENSVGGRLPVSLGVDFPVGYGLDRSPTL